MFSCDKVLKCCFILNIILFGLTKADKDKEVLFLDNNNPEKEVADLILSKGYLPNDEEIPKSSIIKNEVSDGTFLQSKLSDEELIKLLNTYPKKTEFKLNDIVHIASNANHLESQDDKQAKLRSRFRTVTSENQAYFKLDHKPVNPDSFKNEDNREEQAVNRLKNILYSRPAEQYLEDDNKKQLMFDILVSQLKSLCCKKSPSKTKAKPRSLEPLLTDFNKRLRSNTDNFSSGPNNFMFLIINDDIPMNGADKEGLISVDPDSLDEKSSVLLLGPILQQLTNIQLKLVMNRITKELSRPEYLPLLQQIADGNLNQEHMKLMKSLVTGPDTRRYIKPHRCNYQSKLAKVYGGPRWIICTGYLNLNQPSLYD